MKHTEKSGYILIIQWSIILCRCAFPKLHLTQVQKCHLGTGIIIRHSVIGQRVKTFIKVYSHNWYSTVYSVFISLLLINCHYIISRSPDHEPRMRALLIHFSPASVNYLNLFFSKAIEPISTLVRYILKGKDLIQGYK